MNPGNSLVWMLSMIILISCNRDNKEKIQYINLKLDTSILTQKKTIEGLATECNSVDGQYIEVRGRFYAQFENVALWDDFGIFPNWRIKFWLDFDRAIDDSTLQKLSGKMVIIKGKIDAKNHGHLHAYLATIKNIYFIKED